jgi:hypothetical protein
MHARARAVRTRATIRAWQYRQRNLAAGAWFRLRRVLADAMAAYVIGDEDARRLLAEGYQAEACGLDVAPPKTLVFVDERRLSRIAGRRQVPVGLGPAVLAASALALVRFDDADADCRHR